MEVAVDVRVSTSRQPPPQTIDQPLSRLRAYVATPPEWHVAAEHIYRDDGSSGAPLHRPGLARLRDRAALAALECIVLPAPDRFARHDVPQLLVVDACTQRGSRGECVECPMSNAPHEQLLVHIRCAGAE